MNYIAVLDYEHLDNAIFLTAFAKAVKAQEIRKGIIIHGESAYTDRLIQTGMMREDACIRSIKDLNRRLIALLADHGVPTIGLHGFQKELISRTENTLELNRKTFDELPQSPFLLLSNLISCGDEGTEALPLTKLASFLTHELDEHVPVLFSMDDQEEIMSETNRPKHLIGNDLDDDFLKKYIPKEFHGYKESFVLSSSADFSTWPLKQKATVVTFSGK
jgi:hypothetical protein